MIQNRLYPLRFSLLTIFLLCLVCFESAICETISWHENEWNYLDASMEISEGIPENATGVLGQIERSGTLRVAVNPRIVPFAFLNPGKTGNDQYSGADLQLARLIAERMGVTLRIIPLEATQVLPALTEDQCDLTISAITYTPQRALSYTLSRSYCPTEATDSIGILVRDDSEIAGLDDLVNGIIIAQSKSIAESTGAKELKNYLEFRRSSSLQTVFEAVLSGDADAGLISLSTADMYFEQHTESGLRLLDNLFFNPDEHLLGYRVAAKKGETQLIAFVNGVIDEVLADGLYDKWTAEAVKQASESGL